MKRIVYISLGCICFILGAIGSFLPLLPTVPFLLLCAYFFGRSSEKLNNWFKQTKLYKNNLESYVEHRGMTKKTKICTVLTLSCLFSVGFFMMNRVPVARGILLFVWAVHLYYFLWRVKTIEVNTEEKTS